MKSVNLSIYFSQIGFGLKILNNRLCMKLDSRDHGNIYINSRHVVALSFRLDI